MTKGYDNLPMFFQTVLDIPMFEESGALARDIARPPAVAEEHTMALEGGTIAWAPWPLSNVGLISFNGVTPDRLSLSAANSLSMDYQAGAFSGAVWVYPTTLIGAIRTLFCKGVAATDGWCFEVAGGNGAIYFRTSQAGADQETISAVGEVVLNTWYLLGFSRLGASARLYKNGVDVSSTIGAHVNPVSAAARELHIGCVVAHANGWTGYMWRPRIWSRQISAAEMQKIFNMERGLFGV